MTGRGRRWAIPIAVAAAVCALAPAAGAAVGARAELAETYAPIINLRVQQDPPCDSSAEQFQPTTVDVVLGNPAVDLITPDAPPKAAPTARDIAGLGSGYYLDLPGDPLNPGCTYGRAFAELADAGDAPPITYAHFRRQPDHPGFVLQYWFYYYFNQFNDLHESDWEGMQIVFDATTPAAALRQGPSEIALFQHGGGEKAGWDDAKVEKDGTHPVVYAAAGSHATFYSSNVFIENGQRGSGLGCDDTSEPLHSLPLRPVVVPTHASERGRFAWLTFEGRWGQREDGYNNGPTGPNTKLQWLRPFETQDSLRTASPVLPRGAIAGPAITSAFCGAVAEVSQFINLRAQSTTGALVLALIMVAIVAAFVLVTRWRPVRLVPLRQPRAFGQLIRAARQLYGRHWRTMTVVGLATLPVLAALYAVGFAVERAWDGIVGDTFDSIHIQIGAGGSAIPFVTSIGYAVISGAVIVYCRELEAGRAPGPIDSFRGLRDRFWRVALSDVAATLVVLMLALTVIGIPLAIWKYVQWQFVQQEVVYDDRSITEAFRASAARVRGHWWYTARVVVFLWLLGIVAGPILGFALIFANFSLVGIDLLGSIVFVLLLPYFALARTLLYLDLAAEVRTSV